MSDAQRPVHAGFDAARAQPTVVGRWGPMLVRVVVISALIGVAVSFAEPARGATLENVIYSECIGIAICVLQIAGRLHSSKPLWTLRHHATWSLVAVPLGFVVGINGGALVTGRPIGIAAFSNVAPFAGVVTIVASASYIYYFWSRHRLLEASAARADAERLTAETRLKLLQTQIEPHMLFNTLANLRMLVELDPPRAQAMIDQLIVYLRGTLAASRKPSTTLADEFAQLAAYLELMTVRMAHRLRYVVDLPPALAAIAIPPMLLQPLVENAIKHGLEPKVDGGTVRVTASGDGTRVVIVVDDDGVGLDATAPGGDGAGDGEHLGGYGLEHVRERVAGRYGDRGTVTIATNAAGGVTVRLDLPRDPTPEDAR